MIKNPCHECTRRFLGCHSICQEYEDYLTLRHAEDAAKQKYLNTMEFLQYRDKKRGNR